MPYFDNTAAGQAAKAQYITQYDAKVDAYAQANFAPAVVTAYETFKQQNPNAPFVENFQSQQQQLGQNLKAQIFIGSNDAALNIPARIVDWVKSNLATTQQVQTAQALYNSDPTWVDRGIASGQLDVGSLLKSVNTLQNTYTPQQLGNCSGAQSVQQRQNCEATSKTAQLQQQYSQTFYNAYLSTLTSDQKQTFNTSFAASDVGKQCMASGTSESNCQVQNFNNFLQVSKDANYLLTSGGSKNQTTISSALGGNVNYAGINSILSDPLTQLALAVNAHTNGNLLQGQLRTNDANAKWRSGDQNIGTWWEGTSGRIQSSAQVAGEALMVGTGVGAIADLGVEGLTAKAALQIGSTLLSEKMTGDSLAQTANACYNMQTGDQRWAWRSLRP